MFEDAFTSFPVLQTDRLVLRKLVEKDAGLLDLCLSDPDWLRFTDYPSDFDFSKGIPLFNNEAYNAKVMLRWGIILKSDDTCVGDIYLMLPHGDDDSGRRMEIGYEIVPSYRNKGYANEAMKETIQYGFEQMNLKRIEALIMTDNIASIKACEKAGFTREGILRNYRHYIHRGAELRDMVIYSYISSDTR